MAAPSTPTTSSLAPLAKVAVVRSNSPRLKRRWRCPRVFSVTERARIKKSGGWHLHALARQAQSGGQQTIRQLLRTQVVRSGSPVSAELIQEGVEVGHRSHGQEGVGALTFWLVALIAHGHRVLSVLPCMP